MESSVDGNDPRGIWGMGIGKKLTSSINMASHQIISHGHEEIMYAKAEWRKRDMNVYCGDVQRISHQLVFGKEIWMRMIIWHA